MVNQFWETYEELSPWIEETRALIAQLPAPAIDHDQLRQQQEEMRQLRESIAEHKPHIDKLLKIGPQLKELNPEEGKMVEEKYQKAENMYAQIKEEVRQWALALDEAVAQSAQVCVYVLNSYNLQLSFKQEVSVLGMPLCSGMSRPAC